MYVVYMHVYMYIVWISYLQNLKEKHDIEVYLQEVVIWKDLKSKEQ